MSSTVVDRRLGEFRNRTGVRRSYPRIRASLSGFYASSERMLMIKEGDLNLRGTFIKTSAPDVVGTEATVRLLLTEDAPMLRIPARVVWSNQDPDRGPVGMGLRFQSLENWQRKRVAAVLIRSGGIASFPALAKSMGKKGV